ncbi:MAG: hypothetical protein K2N35_03585 [Muribaculaceae bacterium]|nr:hypothetical protein [Muribaculaceae bacterium]
MKKIFIASLFCFTSIIGMAQSKITLSVGDKAMTATLVDNEATRELESLLSKGPIEIQMSDYGGFEKVGALPQSFTTSNRQITTEPGDIMLYQGNNIVIFYGTNSWSYTPLGRIYGASASELRQFLGEGKISLKISLEAENGVENIYSEAKHELNTVYDINGNLVNKRPLPSGLYVINGKKTLIR